MYRNACQSCHQPDGRGQDRVAPSLVGSCVRLAVPEVPIRILLGGKEGDIGLMPPLGTMLSDEQIAAVLTYIRREWGQSASPVEPDRRGRHPQGHGRPATSVDERRTVEDRGGSGRPAVMPRRWPVIAAASILVASSAGLLGGQTFLGRRPVRPDPPDGSNFSRSATSRGATSAISGQSGSIRSARPARARSSSGGVAYVQGRNGLDRRARREDRPGDLDP